MLLELNFVQPLYTLDWFTKPEDMKPYEERLVGAFRTATAKAAVLCESLSHVIGLLQACPVFDFDAFRKQLWPRDHLGNGESLFSMDDLRVGTGLGSLPNYCNERLTILFFGRLFTWR
jgi:hypothetical protein